MRRAQITSHWSILLQHLDQNEHANKLKAECREEVHTCNELVQDFNDTKDRHDELIKRKRKEFNALVDACNKNATRLNDIREKYLACWAKLGEVEHECKKLEKELKCK